MIQRFNIFHFLGGGRGYDTVPTVMPLAALSKACVYGRPLSGIAGSNPVGGGCLSLVSAVCAVR